MLRTRAALPLALLVASSPVAAVVPPDADGGSAGDAPGSPEGAKPVEAGLAYDGRLLHVEDEADFYALPPQAGDRVRVHASASGAVCVNVHGPQGPVRPPSCTSWPVDLLLDFPRPAEGSLFVRSPRSARSSTSSGPTARGTTWARCPAPSTASAWTPEAHGLASTAVASMTP